MAEEEDAIMDIKEQWYFVGDPEERYFDTKLETEKACRLAFPDESATKRYARVYYKETIIEEVR